MLKYYLCNKDVVPKLIESFLQKCRNMNLQLCLENQLKMEIIVLKPNYGCDASN